MYQSIKHREALEWEADASLTKNDCSFAGLMKMSGGMMVRPLADPQMNPGLPVLRHSSQPRALGFTGVMVSMGISSFER